jgi:hypothetical protein
MTEDAQNPRQAPVRETFHAEFFRRAQAFVQDALILVPELEGVTIVPSWEVPQDRLPYGLIMGRDGPLRQPQEVMHMAQQMHGCLQTLMNTSLHTLRETDARMGELAEAINVKRQELYALQQEAEAIKHAERGTAGDDPAARRD